MSEPELIPEALDIQHDTDPAQDHGPARRIPHIGHAVLFFSLAFMSINFGAAILYIATGIKTSEAAALRPGIGLIGETLGYIITIALSFRFFPLLWQRSFLHGIQWNVLAAHRRWFWIVPSAIALGIAANFADNHLNAPQNQDVLRVMSTAHGAWLFTAMGVLVAPLMEEIAFRGFLLPALATAYDWLSLERSPAGLRRWENTSGHTTAGVIFGAVSSCLFFALLHGMQLKFAWGPLAVLFVVGLAFSWVRVRCHSVACSTLMHATYNLTTFAWVFYATGGYRHMDKL